MQTTMQNLNNRLENYVEKVKNLERANTKLEKQIIEFLQKRGPGAERDYSKYKATIADLKSKVSVMRLDHRLIGPPLESIIDIWDDEDSYWILNLILLYYIHSESVLSYACKALPYKVNYGLQIIFNFVHQQVNKIYDVRWDYLLWDYLLFFTLNI